MRIPSKPLLFWAPRVFCLLYAVFFSLFALDAFDEAHGFWKTVLAIFIHLVPTWIVLGILALSWRWEWTSALLSGCVGVWYVISTSGRMHWSAYVLISGPLFLVGSLFLIDWLYRTRIATRSLVSGK
jgi:hypothetical protein